LEGLTKGCAVLLKNERRCQSSANRRYFGAAADEEIEFCCCTCAATPLKMSAVSPTATTGEQSGVHEKVCRWARL
jgi:hypothetical protein